MCKACKDGHLVEDKISVILEKGNKEILVHNVECFSCTCCHYILLVDKIINQLKNTPGIRIKLLGTQTGRVTAA
jgi:YgiT-type zinc finger domain-containing protein